MRPDNRWALLRRHIRPFDRHVSPEAAAGGEIALIADGDTIDIDIPARTINVRLESGEMERRRKAEQARGKAAYSPRRRNRTVSRALKAYASMVTFLPTAARYATTLIKRFNYEFKNNRSGSSDKKRSYAKVSTGYSAIPEARSYPYMTGCTTTPTKYATYSHATNKGLYTPHKDTHAPQDEPAW